MPKIFFHTTELDYVTFVAIVTHLPWQQRKVRLQFRSLNLYIRSELHTFTIML